MQNSSPVLSVIIPVFNREKTLSTAVDSVLKINSGDIELILVDDGSTDKSGFLCDEYAKKDARVKVFHKENGGVSSARNVGIQNAKGKYIYFADSDDMVHTSVLSDMVALAEMSCADIVFANYETEDLSKGKKTIYNCNIPNTGVILDKNYIMYTLLYRFYISDNIGLSNLWNKLYSAQLVKNAGTIFDEQRTHGEDWAFNIQILQFAKKIIALNEIVYTYRLDGTQNYNKYSKNLGYSLANGYELVNALNKKYLFCTENSYEAKCVAVRFFEQIIQYLKMDVVSNKEKRNFIKTDAVKKAIKIINNIKNTELKLFNLSRKDKLKARLILCGSIKLSMKIG